MNKKIWVINQFAGTPESGWGERHFYFAKYWQEKGYDVTIISGSFNHMFRKTIEVEGLCKIETYNGIRFCWVNTPKYDPKSVKRFFAMLVFAWRVLFLKKHLHQTPDDIIVSSMPIFPVLTGYFLKKKYKSRKLLFEIRDIWPLSLIELANVSKYHPLALFIGWFEKFGYRKSDIVVSLLPNAREHIENVAKRPVNFEYIPNGIDPDQLKDEVLPDEIAALLPQNAGMIIGYTGTLGKANALEYFVEAARNVAATHPDIHYVLVGDGYLKEELMKASEGCPQIHFLPKIKKDQVQNMLGRFDVCFVGRNDTPLYKHGISANKYFDYMLAGKPILDSINYIKDPVELCHCGIIVKPDSTRAIEEGILLFHGMTREERKKMGEKGRDYVLKEHSIKILAEKYVEAINA
ncbi:glycosyltransferase family 4 protein [Chitinophaga sp. NPDC101104]|uniref:glycosyltransferase family 4 protein n=1 Tax=Chitinophaga sp. NPDC101104 TaxID=3390561 RepID=UPI003D0364DE